MYREVVSLLIRPPCAYKINSHWGGRLLPFARALRRAKGITERSDVIPLFPHPPPKHLRYFAFRKGPAASKGDHGAQRRNPSIPQNTHSPKAAPRYFAFRKGPAASKGDHEAQRRNPQTIMKQRRFGAIRTLFIIIQRNHCPTFSTWQLSPCTPQWSMLVGLYLWEYGSSCRRTGYRGHRYR